MPTVFEVPTRPQPQTQQIRIGGVQYRLTTRWNQFANCWMLDVADQNGNNVLTGQPLITGANLLAQFGYLNLMANGVLIVQTDISPDQVPNANSLGVTGHLFYIAP